MAYEMPVVNDETVRRLIKPIDSARGWMKLLGVLSIIYGVILAISIIGLIIAWLPIWLGVLLWQGADKAEQAETSGNEQDAVEALNKIRTIFTIYGVLALIGLIVAVVYIIVVIAVIAGGGIELDTLGGFTSR